MNNETNRIADLLLQAYQGERGSKDGWHGPAIWSLVSNVTWKQASGRFHPRSHSIWELVLHMAVWDEICVRRLSGERIMMTTGSEGDWPAVGRANKRDWDLAKKRLRTAQKTLVAATRALRDKDLEKRVAGWRWTYRLMLHGTLHHDLYHAGQIALLRHHTSGTS